ncbi:MAG: N-acetylmuramoyl-L-alanine amidase [Rhizobiaceae bacterium]|nr:N-acetylmuramoyl-L-alanine amidase [Rhizobiaceae bacterium]MCV0407187.1 N-acetylmuramoyl-L-alanine amidase [Rhizobiaceae bacterium]
MRASTERDDLGIRAAICCRGALLLSPILLILLLITAFPAFGQDAGGAGATFHARDYRMAGDATRTRVLLNFDREPGVKWFLLRGPHRLVIDLPDTRFAIEPDDLEPRGLVQNVRYGALGEGRARIILSSDGPFTVEDLSVIENEDGGYRLVADLAAASQSEFDAALSEQSGAGNPGVRSTNKSDRVGASPAAVSRKFSIVIDPGHGGIDGGARGKSGTAEKDVTLAFARELRDTLEETGDYDVHLTRDSDTFLRLDERVRIARQHHADLFLSIHADTIRLSSFRGATVYTLSEKASDPEAEALAIRENLSDEVAGLTVDEADPQVTDILVDLVRRETHGFSIRFARSLIGELTGQVQLVNRPHRFAGFRVLRAPDVPSVLLELGYLSNEKDEAQLLDPDWRRKAVGSIAAAISTFADVRTGAGG